MNTGETVSFTCHHGAIGTALRIRIVDRVTTLTLCEVSVYGTGMNEWYVWYATYLFPITKVLFIFKRLV